MGLVPGKVRPFVPVELDDVGSLSCEDTVEDHPQRYKK